MVITLRVLRQERPERLRSRPLCARPRPERGIAAAGLKDVRRVSFAASDPSGTRARERRSADGRDEATEVMSETRPSSGNATFLFAYLVLALTLSPLVGLVRSIGLFTAGTLPDQYLLHGVALNAALAAACGLALGPAAWLLWWLSRRTRSQPDPLRTAGLA